MTDQEFRIVWTPPALRSLNRLPEKITLAVLEFVHGPVAVNPRRVGKEMHFELTGVHSTRRGDYSVLYRIDEQTRTVEIVTVAHRADVYRSRGSQ